MFLCGPVLGLASAGRLLALSQPGVLYVMQTAEQMLAGFQMLLTGIVADLINGSRNLLEDVSYRLRRLESEALAISLGCVDWTSGLLAT